MCVEDTPRSLFESRRDGMFVVVCKKSTTCRPSGTQQAGAMGILMFSTHLAPMELKTGISNIFRKFFYSMGSSLIAPEYAISPVATSNGKTKSPISIFTRTTDLSGLKIALVI